MSNKKLIILTCALTQGYTLDCRDNVGGLKAVYITEWANVNFASTGYTATSGTITALPMLSTHQFWTYDLEKETGSLVENIQTNDANGTVWYEQDIDFPIRKMQASERNEIRNIAKNRLAIIVLDRNGKYWLCGEKNGMELQPSNANSGKAMGDYNGYMLKFKGKEEAPMQEVSASIIPALLIPAV
jgi:hypothetical protein